MWKSGTVARMRAAVAHASRSTQRSIATIIPDSSATGMKPAGGIVPRSGWFQRTSASQPTIRSLARSTSGWYSSISSPRSTA